MDQFNVYKDMKARTNGEIYIGVVGPVRTGKSTFIKRFMNLMVLPNIEDENDRNRANDELPQSSSGKTIMTTEPKFVPNEAVSIKVEDGIELNVRLIDCVGYMVKGATGHMEGEEERLVKTPWFDEEIPFEQAAEIGTRKVIQEHSTIGILVTTDGSITDIPRQDYIKAEVKKLRQCEKFAKWLLFYPDICNAGYDGIQDILIIEGKVFENENNRKICGSNPQRNYDG